MRFSVVIPLYNKEKYIKETLDSVKAQTFDDYEVIVVNDSSTDNGLSFANEYENDLRYKVYTIPNSGVSAARNYGVEHSKGEYVCFLDADDLWKPNYLEEADRLLKKYGERNFLCFAYDAFEDKPSNIVRHRNLKKFFSDDDKVIDFYKYSVLSKCSVALTSAVVIKKTRLKELDHCFPLGVSMGEDVDLWVRAAAEEDIVYSNKALMLYRVFAVNSLTSLFFVDLKKEFPYWKWYELECNSKRKDEFTTLMIYALARKLYSTQEYKMVVSILRKSVGGYLFWHRNSILILSLIKQALCIL